MKLLIVVNIRTERDGERQAGLIDNKRTDVFLLLESSHSSIDNKAKSGISWTGQFFLKQKKMCLSLYTFVCFYNLLN